MSSSMLAAIRDGVAGAVELAQSTAIDGDPSKTKELTMSETPGKPAATTAGISQADHDAAIATARTEGAAQGATDERLRLSAALTADGIKGDGKRMSAALDLAVKSPGMSAADVTAFVAGNVAASATQDAPQNYETLRAAAGGLTQPDGGKPAKSGLSARIDRHANPN